LEKGYIVASSSRYGSPTFTVKKKDGSLRIVHDYRKLNEYTVLDVTPLPKSARSSKNYEESHCSASSISGQGITTYAY